MHPQTQARMERFQSHVYEPRCWSGREFKNLLDCQKQFDPWRQIYNYERLDEALDSRTGDRYRTSARSYRENFAEWPAHPRRGKEVQKGEDFISHQEWHMSKAFWRPSVVFHCPTNRTAVWKCGLVPAIGVLNLTERETGGVRACEFALSGGSSWLGLVAGASQTPSPRRPRKE